MRSSDRPDLTTLQIETRDEVVLVRLNRPEHLNVMDLTMRSELKECFAWLKGSGARAVIVTGAGEEFCAGGDAREFVDSTGRDLHELMAVRSHGWFREFYTLPQPIIAAVNGTAAGGGVNLALGCDIVLASPSARFGETFIRLGLVPDLGGAFLLPRLVGLQRAKYLAMTGRLLSAGEALQMGLVAEVVEDVVDRAWALAGELAGRSAPALRAIKSSFNSSFEGGMDAALERELYTQSFIFSTDEFRESLKGFFARSSNTPNRKEVAS